MEENKNIKQAITVNPTGSILEILEGKASSPINPAPNNHYGNIRAAADWYLKKKSINSKIHIWDPTHITIAITANLTGASIVMEANEHIKGQKETISGALVISDELKQFTINNPSGFLSPREMARHLKFRRPYFSNRDQYQELLNGLENFKVKINTEIEDYNNFKGQKKYLFEKQIKHELKLNFDLFIPIFKGEESEKFNCEIMFDIEDGGTKMWIESIELLELQATRVSEIVNRESKRLKELTIIYTN